jgi:putative ABC transport system permease protein
MNRGPFNSNDESAREGRATLEIAIAPSMLHYLPLVFKNARRNRRRTALTVLSIGASFCLLGVLMAMYYGFYLAPERPDESLRLVTRNHISLATVLPYSYLERIRRVPGVREAMVLNWFGGTYKDNRDLANMFARFAVEPAKLLTLHPEMRLDAEQNAAFIRDRTGCVIGAPLAERHHLKLGDRVTLIGDIYPVTLELTVRGIYLSDRDTENLYFSFEYLREASPRGYKDFVSMYHVIAVSPADVARIGPAIDEMFRNSTAETKTETEHAFTLSFLSYIGDVKLFLLSICGALTFTVLLVAANTVAMSVRERVREVGILKTLGYSRGAVMTMLLSEAVLIALAGAALGLAMAGIIIQVLRTLPSVFADMRGLRVPPEVLGVALLLAVVVGVAAAAVPAWNASRKSIVACLRFND